MAASSRWRGDARAYAALREAEAELAAERARVAAAEAEADFAAHAHEELTKLAVQPGEEEALAERRQAMMQGEKVAADIREAHDILSGDAAILPVLAAISRRLQRRMPQAPDLIEPSVKALDEAMRGAGGATQRGRERARAPATSIRASSSAARSGCSRCAAWRANIRRRSTSLPALAEKFAAELAALERRRSARRRARGERAPPRAAYATAAAQLSKARERARGSSRSAVNAELPPLKLERARFTVEITRDATARLADGYDRAEFCVQTNPGSRPGPLMKVASGGELARFLLALKVSLAERGTAPTLVFDEIDTGVGGAVADAIGQRLARLAGTGAGARGHPRAPGRGALAPATFRSSKAMSARASGSRPACWRSTRPRAARKSPACWPAPKSPSEARAAAKA